MKQASIALLSLLVSAGIAHADTRVVGRDGATIQATLDGAAEGDTVLVPEGVYLEHVRVETRVTLRGEGAIIDGEGTGTVLTISAPNTIVEGLVVRGSGSDLGAPDVCIYTEPSATGVQIRDNEVTDCAFGIWIHQSHHGVVVDNRVHGGRDVRMADRGNGIHLFDANHLEVMRNVVTGSRDGIYVSATDESIIAENRADGQRFGIHYMYSNRNTVRDNQTSDNTGGIALMQSRNLIVTGNVARNNDRFGLLFRDAQECQIKDNVLERNGQGMFFFSSTDNVITGNRVAHNDMGAKIWAGSRRNQIERNAFVGNRQQIFYVGAEDLVLGTEGVGNRWSDYTGWDQNDDGIGDRPYRVDSFTANLLYAHPSAVLLLRSPVLELLSHLESRLPMLRVPTVVDRSPLMGEAR